MPGREYNPVKTKKRQWCVPESSFVSISIHPVWNVILSQMSLTEVTVTPCPWRAVERFKDNAITFFSLNQMIFKERKVSPALPSPTHQHHRSFSHGHLKVSCPRCFPMSLLAYRSSQQQGEHIDFPSASTEECWRASRSGSSRGGTSVSRRRPGSCAQRC